MRNVQRDSEGSILVLTMFVMMTVAILSISFWEITRMTTRTFFLREKNIQAFYAARAGIEDAIYEIREGNDWQIGQVSPQWEAFSGDTFMKSTSGSTPITHFSYPATIFVTVSGDPDVGTVNIVSTGEVTSPQESTKIYRRTLSAQVIKSEQGVFVFEIKEI